MGQIYDFYSIFGPLSISCKLLYPRGYQRGQSTCQRKGIGKTGYADMNQGSDPWFIVTEIRCALEAEGVAVAPLK